VLKTARTTPGPTEPGLRSEPTTPPFPCPWLSRLVKASPTQCTHPTTLPKSRVDASLELNSTSCTFLLACMRDCAVRRLLHLAVQVPCKSYISRSFQKTSSPALLPIPTLATPPRLLHPTRRGLHRPGCERTCACVNDSIISFLFLRRHSSATLDEIVRSLQVPSSCVVAVLLTTILSLRLTTVACDSHSSINPSVPAQSRARYCVIRTCSFPTSRHCIHSRSRSL